MQINLGDKIWMNFGPNGLIVGYVLDHSPDYQFVGISPVPYDSFKKMPLVERAQIPISWHDVKYCSYVCRVPYEQLQKIDQALKPQAGFLS